jgi:hypothetical protein
VQKIFVSYSHADSALVAPVVRLLRAARSFVFLDVDSIEPARRWQDVIQGAIDDADLVVVFWCFHSSGSQEVQREWTAAIRSNKPLLPVLLDSTPVTAPIDQFQWIDFKELGETRHPAAGASRSLAKAPSSARAARPPLLGLAAAAVLGVSLLGGVAWLSLRRPSPGPPEYTTTTLVSATPTPTRMAATPEPSPSPTPGPTPTGQPAWFWVGVLGSFALLLLFPFLAIRARRRRSRRDGTRPGESASAQAASVEARLADAIHSELVRRLEPRTDEPPRSG